VDWVGTFFCPNGDARDLFWDPVFSFGLFGGNRIAPESRGGNEASIYSVRSTAYCRGPSHVSHPYGVLHRYSRTRLMHVWTECAVSSGQRAAVSEQVKSTGHPATIERSNA
jgi:hypothetical protein